MDSKSIHNNQNFLSMTPMIRETLEKRRAEELISGRVNHQSMMLLNPMMADFRNSQMSNFVVGNNP